MATAERAALPSGSASKFLAARHPASTASASFHCARLPRSPRGPGIQAGTTTRRSTRHPPRRASFPQRASGPPPIMPSPATRPRSVMPPMSVACTVPLMRRPLGVGGGPAVHAGAPLMQPSGAGRPRSGTCTVHPAPCTLYLGPPPVASPPSLRPSRYEFRSGDAYYSFSEATQTKRRDNPPRRNRGRLGHSKRNACIAPV
jgi:hypothetical protein